MKQRASFPHRMDAPVSTPLAFRGPWFKKQTKIQKSKAIASLTQDRDLMLCKLRAVKFSTYPLNAPVRGVRGDVGWVHPNILCLIFSTPNNVMSTPTKRWLATSLAGAEMKCGRAQLCFAILCPVKKRVECRRPFAVKNFFCLFTACFILKIFAPFLGPTF